MTESEAIDLGRRALSCRGWAWRPGMATLEAPPRPPCITIAEWDAARVIAADDGDTPRACTVLGKVRDLHPDALPNFRDACTVGGLLALVREAWGDQTIHVEVGFTGPGSPPNYWLRSGCGRDEPYADETSEPAALVSALESAP